MSLTQSPKSTARVAGLLYLVVVITGIINLAYVPGKQIVWDNPAQTVKNIQEGELLFRLGIVAGLVCYTAFLFLPLVLYRLFKPVDRILALAMVVLAVVSVPISLVNMGNKMAVLTLLAEPNVTAVPEQLQSQVMFYLRSYGNGNRIASIFWGLWLFPLGLLVVKSGMIPKFLGVLLMLGCIGYLVNFAGNFLVKDFGNMTIADYITLPASIGEIGTCLWLLVMGAKTPSAGRAR